MIACQTSAPSVAPSPPAGDIVIGSDLPITGFEGDTPPLAQAIQLAIEQHSQIGRFKVAYWSLDDAVGGDALPEKGIQNIDQFIDVHRVLGVIAPSTSYMGVAQIPIANPVPLVMISPTATRDCLTRSRPACYSSADKLRPSGPNTFFRIAPPDPLQGAAMAQYLVEDLHLQRAAILNEMGADGATYAESFSMRLTHLRGDIVWSEDLNSGTQDFKAFMSTASARGAQAIFALGGVDDGICRAASQMPPGMVFLGTDNFTDDPGCVTQAGNAAEGMIGTYGDVDATKLPGAKQVVNAYSKMFPRTNAAAHFIFAAYDCALILIEAIQYAVTANNDELPSRAQVLAAIARTNSVYQGVTGSYSFDSNGDAKVPMMSIYQVKAGKWTFVQRLDVTND
jgi:ABC-type branched-subunit amino acid transport system substrate-binding protein